MITIHAIQTGLTRIVIVVALLWLTVLIGIMVFWSYPLKMDAKGNLLPEQRRWVYSPTEAAYVVDFPPGIVPGATKADWCG